MQSTVQWDAEDLLGRAEKPDQGDRSLRPATALLSLAALPGANRGTAPGLHTWVLRRQLPRAKPQQGVCTLECQRDTLCPVGGGISCVAAGGVPDGTETAQQEN